MGVGLVGSEGDVKRIVYFAAVLAFGTIFLNWVHADVAPELLLAEKFESSVDVHNYWISEKLDGVRAYWDGKHLLSRQGNRFYTPPWFTRNFPDTPLDGELWIARNAFEQVISTVRKHVPVESEWKSVNYYVFELPGASGSFSDRIEKINHIVATANNPHLRAVKQFRVPTDEELLVTLDKVVKNGGEGLMLHHQDALYHTGRSDALLKLKHYEDAEAKVIAYVPGKGRNAGRMGSLIVESFGGKRFRIGSGFSDEQRENPPKIGTIITYKYYGLTRKGLPRFASFLRERPDY